MYLEKQPFLKNTKFYLPNMVGLPLYVNRVDVVSVATSSYGGGAVLRYSRVARFSQ